MAEFAFAEKVKGIGAKPDRSSSRSRSRLIPRPRTRSCQVGAGWIRVDQVGPAGPVAPASPAPRPPASAPPDIVTSEASNSARKGNLISPTHLKNIVYAGVVP
ncbi:MAG: hypothetical protein Q9157_006147 [Trypethelium eluteriae]